MDDRPFNVDEPIAHFITWTAYGTWLPGDERGSWHRGEFQRPNALFREVAATKMKETAFTISATDRELVENIARRHCEIRRWALHAIAARSNHVHVVVTASGYQPETVRDQLKAWCTRRLKHSHPGRRRFWTEGGSCRAINREEDLETAVGYVRDAQDRKGAEG